VSFVSNFRKSSGTLWRSSIAGKRRGLVELHTSDVVKEESEQIATACSRRHDGEAAGGRRLSGGARDEVVQRPRRSDPTEKKHKK
jgi:hypothetical protein